MTVAEGGGKRAIQRKFQDVYVPALKANYLVWPAVQILNFRVMPIQFQIVSRSLGSSRAVLIMRCSLSSQALVLHGLLISPSPTPQKRRELQHIPSHWSLLRRDDLNPVTDLVYDAVEVVTRAFDNIRTAGVCIPLAFWKLLRFLLSVPRPYRMQNDLTQYSWPPGFRLHRMLSNLKVP